MLERQAARQREAAAILDDLAILERLATVGRPVVTGGVALGLLVAPDIDITTLCPSLDVAAVFPLGQALAAHPRVRRLTFRNDTGPWNTDPSYPDGLYWQVEVVTDAGSAWSLDLWFLAEGTTQFDLEHLRTLAPRLTEASRTAILAIKEDLLAAPPPGSLPSYEVYRAVLDEGIETPAAFRAWHAGTSA